MAFDKILHDKTFNIDQQLAEQLHKLITKKFKKRNVVQWTFIDNT